MSIINSERVSWLDLLLPPTERVPFSCANVASSLQESHMLLPAQYLDLLMRNSFQALKPIINWVTSWDNDLQLNGRPLRAQSSADVPQLEVAAKTRRASVWFPPSWGHKGVYFWFLPISQLFAWLFFFHVWFSKQASYQLFLRTSRRIKTWSLDSLLHIT